MCAVIAVGMQGLGLCMHLRASNDGAMGWRVMRGLPGGLHRVNVPSRYNQVPLSVPNASLVAVQAPLVPAPVLDSSVEAGPSKGSIVRVRNGRGEVQI